MRQRKGYSEAQTYEEMVDAMELHKREGQDPHGQNSMYRLKNGYKENEVKDLISVSIKELAEVATKEKISLSDTNEVKRRCVVYLRACQESGTFPSILGLARSLGYSRKTIYSFLSVHPDHPTSHFIGLFQDTCADLLSQSALKNSANVIMSIFLSKALYEMRETQEVIIKPETPNDDLKVDTLLDEYGIETEGDVV